MVHVHKYLNIPVPSTVCSSVDWSIGDVILSWAELLVDIVEV